VTVCTPQPPPPPAAGPPGRGSGATGPSPAFESLNDARPGGRVQPDAASESPWADGAVAREQDEIVEVDVLEIDMCADVMVDRRRLVTQLAQRHLDLGGQLPSALAERWPWAADVRRSFLTRGPTVTPRPGWCRLRPSTALLRPYCYRA
jgi:hypothetical protein